jgi:hypothetical protein
LRQQLTLDDIEKISYLQVGEGWKVVMEMDDGTELISEVSFPSREAAVEAIEQVRQEQDMLKRKPH